MLKLDMVLTNATSRPPICKAYNYREDLYKKFVKEVVEKDIPKCTLPPFEYPLITYHATSE